MEETSALTEEEAFPSRTESTLPPQTMLDQLVSDDRSQILKAALPYLPEQGRGIFAIYAKFLELQHTFRVFKGSGSAGTGRDVQLSPAAGPDHPADAQEDYEQEELLHAASAPQTGPLEMLQEIRRYVQGPARNQIDNLVNMLAMVQMLQIMNESEGT